MLLTENGLTHKAAESAQMGGDFLPQVLCSKQDRVAHYFIGLRIAQTRLKVVPVGTTEKNEKILIPFEDFLENDILLIADLSSELDEFCEVYGVDYNQELGI